MGLNHTLLVVAVILIVVDVFIETDVATFVAYLLLCYVGASVLPAPLAYQVLFGVLLGFALVGLHYLVWRRFIESAVHKRLAPDKIQVGARDLIGKTGAVKEIDGVLMVALKGDLWNVEEADKNGLSEGSRVRVTGETGGTLAVEAIENEEA